jgi:predicted enzyme related to lactoylglutathione lyase
MRQHSAESRRHHPVHDLRRPKSFYQNVFGGSIDLQDERAVVFIFGDTLINLLDERATGDLIEPELHRPGGHVWEIAQDIPAR